MFELKAALIAQYMPDALRRRTSPENIADTLYMLDLMGAHIEWPTTTQQVMDVSEAAAGKLAAILSDYREGKRGLPTYAELAELVAVDAGGCAPPVLVHGDKLPGSDDVSE